MVWATLSLGLMTKQPPHIQSQFCQNAFPNFCRVGKCTKWLQFSDKTTACWSLVILILRTYLYMRHLVSLHTNILRLKNNAGTKHQLYWKNVQMFLALKKNCDRLLKIEG